MTTRFATVDDYLAAQPAATADRLRELIEVVDALVPDAEHGISYQIPTFRVAGRPLVHVAGWKQHLSMYPVPDGPPEFQARVAPYLSGRGTVKFLLRDPLPDDLVREIVRLRLAALAP